MSDAPTPRARRVPLIFVGLLGLVTVADVVDHLTRETDAFRSQALDWSLFSLGSYLLISAVFLGALRVLRPAPTLLAPALAVSLAIVAHVTVSGPLLDNWILGDSGLQFRLAPHAFAIGIGLYYALWALAEGLGRGVARRRERPAEAQA